jgi:hypothetical protein
MASGAGKSGSFVGAILYLDGGSICSPTLFLDDASGFTVTADQQLVRSGSACAPANSRGKMTDRPAVDYLAMKSSDAYLECGADASKWAAFFCQVAKKNGHDLDEGWIFGWFANAMMAMHDHLRPECAPVRLPDGSAFVVGQVG